MTGNRLDDCVVAMTAHELDALVLGRDAHVRAFTDEPRLWLAGTRVFTPAAVVVRATGDVTVPTMTWNPAILAEQLRAVPGFTAATRIGVDGMSPAAHTLLTSVVPDVAFVDATPMLRTLLRVKNATEIDALRAAGRVAADAFAEMVHALQPGITPSRLRARFAFAAAAAHGVTTPAFEAITVNPGGSTWLLTDDEPIDVDRPIVLRGGVLREGWEASLARTFSGGRAQEPEGFRGAIAACVPRARAADLPITHGVGRGIEPLAPDVVLEPGMAVAVEVASRDFVQQDVVLVGHDGPEVLTEIPT